MWSMKVINAIIYSSQVTFDLPKATKGLSINYGDIVHCSQISKLTEINLDSTAYVKNITTSEVPMSYNCFTLKHQTLYFWISERGLIEDKPAFEASIVELTKNGF